VIIMPRQDGTGPCGDGAMTGRRMGPCGKGLRRCRNGAWREENQKQEKEKEDTKKQG